MEMEPGSEANDIQAFFYEQVQLQPDVHPTELDYLAMTDSLPEDRITAASEAYIPMQSGPEQAEFARAAEEVSDLHKASDLHEAIEPAVSYSPLESEPQLGQPSGPEEAVPAEFASGGTEKDASKSPLPPPPEGSVEGCSGPSSTEANLQVEFIAINDGAANEAGDSAKQTSAPQLEVPGEATPLAVSSEGVVQTDLESNEVQAEDSAEDASLALKETNAPPRGTLVGATPAQVYSNGTGEGDPTNATSSCVLKGTEAVLAEELGAAFHGDGIPLIGKKVKKKFGRKNFLGEVQSFDDDNKFYKVQYEDGDEEELEWTELEPLLVKAAETPKERRKPAHTDKKEQDGNGEDYTKKTETERMANGDKDEPIIEEGMPALDSEKRPQRKRFKKMFIDEDPVMQANPRKRRRIIRSDKPLLRLTKAALKRRFVKRPLEESEGEESAEGSAGPEAAKGRQVERKRKEQAGKSAMRRAKKGKSDEAEKPDSGPGADVVGRKARKKFGAKFYTGVIKYFFPKEGFYKVVYADGDKEDLWWHELEPILVPEPGDQEEKQTEAVAETSPKHRGRPPLASGSARRAAANKLQKALSRGGKMRQKVNKVAALAKGFLKRRTGVEAVDKEDLDNVLVESKKRGRNAAQREKPKVEQSSGMAQGEVYQSAMKRAVMGRNNGRSLKASLLGEEAFPSSVPEAETREGKRKVEAEAVVSKKRARPPREATQVEAPPAGAEETFESEEEPLASLQPPHAALTAARFASPSSSDSLEFFGWGEVVDNATGGLHDLTAIKMLPTESPISHLVASQHQLAVITAAGQVMVWRHQHGHVQRRTRQWEHIQDLETRNVVLLDIAGPNIDRSASGYAPEQEDQIPDPFYMAAVAADGEDFVFVGSPPQEEVRTLRLDEEPQFPGLKGAIARSSGEDAAKDVGVVLQVSVGIIESVDESPFIGYITDQNKVYIRAATKDGAQEEVHQVTGFSGAPIKIQCGAAYYAIILTDDGKAWTWGIGSSFSMDPPSAGNQAVASQYASCMLARGSLYGRQVMDVGCYNKDFIVLTEDGEVHHWTHGKVHPALGVFNAPSPPLPSHMPNVPPSDKLISISIGPGVCAGITKKGKVHTWNNGMKGGPNFATEETPLGRAVGTDTQIAALGDKFALGVITVPGSLVVVTGEKPPRALSAKKKGEER